MKYFILFQEIIKAFKCAITLHFDFSQSFCKYIESLRFTIIHFFFLLVPKKRDILNGMNVTSFRINGLFLLIVWAFIKKYLTISVIIIAVVSGINYL